MNIKWEMRALLAALAVLVVWLSFGSAQFLQPQAASYQRHGDAIIATWERATPFGSVWADWSTECQSMQSGIERRNDGTALFQAADGPVSYEVIGPVERCFQDGGEVRVSHKWQIHLWGLILLRPVELEYIAKELM